MTTETKKTAYELACEKMGRTPLTIDNFSMFAESNRKVEFGMHKHNTCTEAANLDAEGKPFIPDFTDGTRKHYPFYWAKKDSSRPSGVGFVFSDTAGGFDGSTLGSRLAFSRNEDIARELGNNPEITEYYNEAMGV